MRIFGFGRTKASKVPFLKPLVQYGAAVIFVVAAFVVRLALSLAVGPGLPTYILFYPIIMLVALIGGAGPGLLATAMGALITVYWVLLPQGQFAIAKPAESLGVALFCSVGVFMSVVAELYRRARQRVAEYQNELSLRESEKRFSTVFNASPMRYCQ